MAYIDDTNGHTVLKARRGFTIAGNHYDGVELETIDKRRNATGTLRIGLRIKDGQRLELAHCRAGLVDPVDDDLSFLVGTRLRALLLDRSESEENDFYEELDILPFADECGELNDLELRYTFDRLEGETLTETQSRAKMYLSFIVVDPWLGTCDVAG